MTRVAFVRQLTGGTGVVEKSYTPRDTDMRGDHARDIELPGVIAIPSSRSSTIYVQVPSGRRAAAAAH